MSTKFTGKVYPNGEFGFVRLRKTRIPLPVRSTATEDEAFDLAAFQVHGLSEALRFKQGAVASSAPVSVPSPAQTGEPLDSSKLTNSHRAKRGEKGITKYGRRMVRNGAFVLQDRFGRRRLSFLTLTLPGMTDEQIREACEKWSEITRVFFQWITRQLKAAGLPTMYVAVTEVQERRATREMRPPLHLHMVFVGRAGGGSWCLSPMDVRQAWQRAVRKQLKSFTDALDFSSAENIQMVRKSAETYLGKYMSKGAELIASWQSMFESFPIPHTWWNCSLAMKRTIARLTYIMPSWICSVLLNCGMEKRRGTETAFSVYLFSIESRFGLELILGGGGVIPRSELRGFREWVKASQEEVPITLR
jgi:hypothetical protein